MERLHAIGGLVVGLIALVGSVALAVALTVEGSSGAQTSPSVVAADPQQEARSEKRRGKDAKSTAQPGKRAAVTAARPPAVVTANPPAPSAPRVAVVGSGGRAHVDDDSKDDEDREWDDDDRSGGEDSDSGHDD